MDNSNDLEFDFSLCHEFNYEKNNVNINDKYQYYRYCHYQGI